jgi:hypothetical protein
MDRLIMRLGLGGIGGWGGGGRWDTYVLYIYIIDTHTCMTNPTQIPFR